ncbi:MAG: O-antigen ligase family protein [Acidimicrobiales bacterium]
MGITLRVDPGAVTQADRRERRWIFGALVAIPPVTVLVPAALSIIGMIAFVVALAWQLPNRARTGLRRPALNRLILVGTGFAVAAFVSEVVHPGGAGGASRVAQFMLVPIGFAGMRVAARHDLRGAVWLGSVVGAITAGAVAISVLLFSSVGRPTSYVNPIHFGELALVLGFVAVVSRGMVPWDRQLVRRLTLAALLGGVIASILSHSRGSWVALPAIIVLAIVHQHRTGGSRTAVWVVAIAALVLPAGAMAASVNDHAALNALDRAVTETTNYVVSDGAFGTGGTSVGARLEMWRSAVGGFRTEPVIGVGWGNLQKRFQLDVAAGVRDRRIAKYEHPHNQYLSHLANGGMIGFASLLALLLMAGSIFARAFRSSVGDMRALGGAGLIVVVGFAMFSLTDAILEATTPLVFFVLMVGALAAQIDRLDDERLFAYGAFDGLEQSPGAVEGPRANTL